MTFFCSACSVTAGECPACGTYWVTHGGKRYGTKPVAENPWPSLIVNGRTVPQAITLNQMPNVVVLTPAHTAAIARLGGDQEPR